MIVLDTSAWVEFLRGTGSGVDDRVAQLVVDRTILVPDVVRLELLAGASDEVNAEDLRRLLARFTPLGASSPADHELAAWAYRRARRAGHTVRSLLDCLIAAMAIRVEAPVLARDRDFEILASLTDLRLA